jgi:hypothetical protein
MGAVIPFDCTLKEIRWFVGNVGAETGSTSFIHKITKNGSGGSSYTRSATPNLGFVAGDTFNLRLTSPTGYVSTNQVGRVRVVFYFEMKE